LISRPVSQSRSEGGAVYRGLERLLDLTGMSTSMVGGRIVTEPLKMGVKSAAKAPYRKEVEKSIRDFSKQFQKQVTAQYRYYGPSAIAANEAIE